MPKKVLIVDSDIDARFLVKVHLRRFNVEFIEARDGESGLELAQSEKPDLVVMDYVLPKLSGYEMVKKIQKDKVTRNIPIIIATIAGFDLQMKELNIVEYLPKPFSREQFLKAVEKALGKIPLKRKEARVIPPGIETTKVAPMEKKEEATAAMKKIVVADDEEEVRELMEELLKDRYLVILARDGLDLIEKVKKERPDLILCDVIMPGQSGYKSIKRLRENPEFLNIPVIFHSGLVKDRELYETLKPEGPSHFMLKPFTKKVLLDKIEEMLK
ncbi:MAG: response regulator [bacterium]